MSWAALLLIAAFTVVQVADWLQPDAHSFRLVTEYGEAVPYVEIEGAGEVRAARWENWRTREQWWMTQHPNDYNSRIFVESRYYDFWVKSAAKRMERNLCFLPIRFFVDGQSDRHGYLHYQSEKQG